jgi:dTDP-4-dehydrorhamnose reductase
MERLLITGASGLLGANLLLAARSTHQLVAVSHRQRVNLDGAECIQADLTVPGAARDLVRTYRPRAVVHCAALTDVDRCEEQPDLAERLNAQVPGWLAEACAAIGARLVHISTDAVFDGEKRDYSEDDVPRPINTYGISKLRGEGAVLAANPSALVIRTNLFGWNAEPKLSLSEWFLDRLRRKERCTGFTDVSVSPLVAEDLGARVLQLLSMSAAGVLHVAGRDVVTKYEFGRMVAEAFGLSPDPILPGSVDASPLRSRRPHQLGLDVRRAESLLGVPMPRVEAGLRRWRQQEQDGTLERLRALVVQPGGSADKVRSQSTEEVSP